MFFGFFFLCTADKKDTIMLHFLLPLKLNDVYLHSTTHS